MRVLLALSLGLLALAPLAPTAAAGPGWCMWNPDFRDLVYEASLGIVHLHDGTICTVHLHRTDLFDRFEGCTVVYVVATGGNAGAYPGDVAGMGPFAATDKLVVAQIGATTVWLSCVL